MDLKPSASYADNCKRSNWDPENVVILSIPQSQTSGSHPDSSNPKLSCGTISLDKHLEIFWEQGEGKETKPNKEKANNNKKSSHKLNIMMGSFRPFWY